MMALDDEQKKRGFPVISRPLGEVHSCHPSIIPVSTLFFLGRVWPWQPKLSLSSHHHPSLKGPSARKVSSRHHPRGQEIIIPPSSKTEGPISKKNIIPSSSKSTENDHPTIIQVSRGAQQEKQKHIGSHHFCAVTMSQPSGMMGKSAQSSTPKVDDGLPSSM